MPAYPRRGEVYLAQLDKLRPVIVLSVDGLNKFAFDVCVVPITTKAHAKFSMRVRLKAGDGGLDYDCWAKCDQVTTLEKDLLKYPVLGTLSSEKFSRVQEQIKLCLGLIQRPIPTHSLSPSVITRSSMSRRSGLKRLSPAGADLLTTS